MTQRGNRRQATFFTSWDYGLYKRLLATECAKAGVAVWAYCLMPNHVHLIVQPTAPDSLARALGRAHQAYTAVINRREGWRGCLWQGRFASFPMEDRHLLAATRYVLMNPRRAGLADSAFGWPHSSLGVHLSGVRDELADPQPMAARIGSWSDLLAEDLGVAEALRFRRHASSGLPLGGDEFLAEIERTTGRKLREPIARFAGVT